MTSDRSRFAGVRFGLSALVLAIAASSCTASGALDRQAHRVSVDVKRPYQLVYRDLRNWARECRQSVTVAAEAKVDGDLYSDVGRAEISHYLQGGLGAAHIFRIEIDRKTPDSSRVVIKRTGYGADDTENILGVAREGFGQC